MSETRFPTIIPESGMYPELIPFAIVIMSGLIPYVSEPNQLPVLPKPHITSSTTTRMSYLLQISWTLGQ